MKEHTAISPMYRAGRFLVLGLLAATAATPEAATETRVPLPPSAGRHTAVGTSSPAQADDGPCLAARTAAVPAAAYAVDHARSTIVAKLNKAGLLRFLGHEHGVVPAAWAAEIRFDVENLSGSCIAVQIDVGNLLIDTPEARKLAGVDPDGPSEEEVEEIRATMLSAEQLDAVEFAAILFESTHLRLDGAELHIDGELTIHGVKREVDVAAELERDGPGYAVRGAFRIKQRDFGIQPVSIGGVVKVADEIDVAFEIFARRR